jgi:hypothetical protein
MIFREKIDLGIVQRTAFITDNRRENPTLQVRRGRVKQRRSIYVDISHTRPESAIHGAPVYPAGSNFIIF